MIPEGKVSSLPSMTEPSAFTEEQLSILKYGQGSSGISYLKALAIQNGFKLSARHSEKSDRIRLYCHRASRGAEHSHTTKTNWPMKLQSLKCGGPYRVQGKCELTHNHDLLSSTSPMIPEVLQAMAKELLRVRVDKSRIPNFFQLITGRTFSRFQLAALDCDDLRAAFETDPGCLLRYMEDKGECRLFEMMID
jgi:hypothetical protein